MRVLKSFVLLMMIFGLSASYTACGKEEPNPAAQKPGGLAVGDKAQDFALVDQSGHVVKLSDVEKGWVLVLVFYRGHWCNACLNQLLDLKNDAPKFAARHAALMAVSVDSIEDSAHFSAEWRFPFPLLSDPKFKLIGAYGARHPEGHDGKDISKPAIIIIDSNKIIRSKHIGTSPVDRPTNDEILFQIQNIQKRP